MLSNLKSRLLLKRGRVHKLLFISIITALLGLPIVPFLKGQFIEAEGIQAPLLIYEEGSNSLLLVQGNTLRPVSPLPEKEAPPQVSYRKIWVVLTAYSSHTWQTDDTPFITAAGTSVRDGIVATNLLPFGAKIRIPEVYGNKVFVVEDRMHPKNYYKVDIWFPSYWEAKTFGVKKTYIEVLR